MKLKGEINQKKDILYLIIAIVLTALVASYLFWFLHSLVEKANVIFSNTVTPGNIVTFDFDRYYRVVGKAFPTSSEGLPVTHTPASSTE